MPVKTRKRPSKARTNSKGGKKKKQAPRGKKRSQEEIHEDEASDSEATRGIDEYEEENQESEDEEVEESGEPNSKAKDTKIAELEAQLKVAQGTAKIVPYTLKGMQKVGASRTYAKLMKDHLVESWWGLQPFTCNDKSLDRISVRLYKTMMSKEDKAIKEEVAKKQAQDTWIALHRDVIRQLFNQIRNYYQGQLRKEWMVHALAELTKISQEELDKLIDQKDKDGNEVGWVDSEGFPTQKYIMEKMPTIITWEECLKVVSRDAKFLGTERGKFVADWWVNCALRKLAGRTHWADSKIFSTPISQATLPKNDFSDEDFPAVASNLEAAGILFMENAAAKWPEFAAKKHKDPDWQYNAGAEYMNCPYSTSTDGSRIWGAFTVVGLERYKVLMGIAKAGRNKKNCVDMEKAILKRLRVKHGYEDAQGNSLKGGSKKKKAKVQDPVEKVDLGDDDMF